MSQRFVKKLSCHCASSNCISIYDNPLRLGGVALRIVDNAPYEDHI
ncbi:MAG: hypothetical protein GX267_01535 [Fibrobacter sp.]|nr:hypothetical protein [Fibrobacter sp.]